MKKLLSLLLVLALCIPCASAVGLTASAAVSTHINMIVTNPGQDMNTQMNISFHADEGYTGCYVEYTTANDTAFASATRANGEQNAEDYKWFLGKHLTMSNESGRYTRKFIHYSVYLDGLTPNTEYMYRICDGQGAYSEVYKFKTAGQQQFSILWSSDIHLTNTEQVKYDRMAATLEYLETLNAYPIGLHYDTGDVVSSGERYGFWETFYQHPIFKKYTYAGIIGNHEACDSMMMSDDQYTQYWKGGEYFRITANYPKNGYTQNSARIGGYLNGDGYAEYANEPSSVLFDPGTGPCAGKLITGANEDLNGRTYWFMYNRILFIQFDYYAITYNAEIGKAFDWANQVIEANRGKYDYLIVSEHLNLWWGQDGTDRNYHRYQQWLDSANVDVFLTGDNHIWFRTEACYDGQNTTEPNKGTYILQSPAITNTGSNGSYEGPAGPCGVKRFSCANYLGGAMFDFDGTKLTVKVAINSAGTASAADYYTYETFDIPMKERERVYEDSQPGYYRAASDMELRENSDSASQLLTTVPAGTVFTVDAISGNHGRVSYGGYTGWVNLGTQAPEYADNTLPAPASFAVDNVNVGFATPAKCNAYTPAYGATIANGGWSFAYNHTITGVRDSTGAYKVTAQDTSSDPKNNTPIPENGCVLLINTNYPQYAALMEQLAVDKYFTLDAPKTLIYTAQPGAAYTEPTIPGGGTTPTPPPTPPTEYAISVTDGTANKAQAAEGETVSLTAAIPAGQEFDKWTGNVEFADAGAASTTFVMPAVPVSVTATFKSPAPPPEEPTELTPVEDSEYELDTYVEGVEASSTAAAVRAQFTNADVRIKDGAGVFVTDDNAAVGTGFTVCCFVDGEMTDSKVVVVRGDISGGADGAGDGVIGDADYASAKNVLKGYAVIRGAFEAALDLNSDRLSSAADIAAIKMSITK